MQDATRNRLLDLILNSTHDAILAVDKEFRVFLFNPAAERITGIPASHAMGKDVRAVIETTRLDQVVSTGNPELNQRQTIGDTTIITNRVPVMSPEGELVGAVAVFRDITEVRVLAEEITNLRQVQTLLSSIINATQDAISVVDAKGNGILINPAYTRLTGLTEKDVIGKPATVDIAEGSSMHMRVLRTRKPVKNVPMKVGPKRRSVVVTCDPVMAGDELLGSVGVVHDVSELMSLNEELERIKKIVRELEAKYTFDEIVSNSPLITQAIDQAKRVASTSVTVLLRGESGTGKELFAHAVHGGSPRRNKPFIRVNCAALTGGLLESELFGYVDGAFTGAKRGGRRGLFEEAEGGTLFLDEIGVMNLASQASLLRVLQEKEIVRVGASKPTAVDVRVIAATNVSLEQMVSEGKFREDLYYRLNVIPIFIPPLRQRVEDLPGLCDELIKRLNQEYGRKVTGIHPDVMEMFRAYRWPGNVRELENVLGRAMISMRYHDEVIEPKHVHLAMPASDEPGVPADLEDLSTPLLRSLSETVDEAERTAIQSALRAAEGNKTKAARLLGMSIRNLYNKMAKHGMS